MTATRRSWQELREFTAALAAADSEATVASATVERVVAALVADAAAIVGQGRLIAAAGFPGGRVPVAALEAVEPGGAGGCIDVPGVGVCAAAARLEYPTRAALVIARGDPLTREEGAVLRAMAALASTRMQLLRAVKDERAAREQLERLAREQVALRRVATLVGAARAPDEVFSAVAETVAELSGADLALVLRYELARRATVVGAWGEAGRQLPIGQALTVAGDGVAVHVLRTGKPARTLRVVGPRGSVAAALRSAGVQVASGSPIVVEGRLWGVLIAARTRPEPLPLEAERRLPALTQLVATAVANAQARAELRAVAAEQAGLRRVATLVAGGAEPANVFAAVAEEVGLVLPGADVTLVSRYDGGRGAEMVGGWSRAGPVEFIGQRRELGGRNVTTMVFAHNEPVRVDGFDDDGAAGSAARAAGIRASAGAPINVEGRLWGVMIAASTREGGLPEGTEQRLAAFTELIATAIAETHAREELSALAEWQAALRRVATLVAHDGPSEVVFRGVARELGQLFEAEAARVIRYLPDRTLTSVGSYPVDRMWGNAGGRYPLVGDKVSTLVFDTGRPVWIAAYAADDSSSVTSEAQGVGTRSAAGAPISVDGSLWGALQVVFSRDGVMADGVEERLAAFAELVAAAIGNARAREDLRALAREQAALRRVATLVAQAPPLPAIFAAVAQEVGSLLDVERARVVRYDADGATTVVGAWDAATETQRATSQPVGAPITLAGQPWGVISVAFTAEEVAPPGTEARLVAFTELIATAIAKAEARSALAASRVRIVASADETRRRVERDLHDGAQQRLVALIMYVRAAQAVMPEELRPLTRELDQVVAGLDGALAELREFARGIHPAILAEGGLGPALRTLARRSEVPVKLDVGIGSRLPERVEVAAYHVVSVALASVATRAPAPVVAVTVTAAGGALSISVAGGGELAHDATVELKDRVEALGGRIETGGTFLVQLPL